MISDADFQELYNMTKAIYHHLGLDGKKPLSINQLQKNVAVDILKWREKKSNKQRHERETPKR